LHLVDIYMTSITKMHGPMNIKKLHLVDIYMTSITKMHGPMNIKKNTLFSAVRIFDL